MPISFSGKNSKVGMPKKTLVKNRMKKIERHRCTCLT